MDKVELKYNIEFSESISKEALGELEGTKMERFQQHTEKFFYDLLMKHSGAVEGMNNFKLDLEIEESE